MRYIHSHAPRTIARAILSPLSAALCPASTTFLKVGSRSDRGRRSVVFDSPVMKERNVPDDVLYLALFQSAVN